MEFEHKITISEKFRVTTIQGIQRIDEMRNNTNIKHRHYWQSVKQHLKNHKFSIFERTVLYILFPCFVSSESQSLSMISRLHTDMRSDNNEASYIALDKSLWIKDIDFNVN